MVATNLAGWYLCHAVPTPETRPKDYAMAGLEHGSHHPREIEDPRIAARNARYGMVLFLLYLTVYSVYVGLNAFFPAVMQATPLLGLNVALLFGFGLIVGAMVLAVLYCWLCRGGSASTAAS